ncbi:hypothetical protein LX16_4860 [Stackebrandtia albiflava]|uniref:Uncharacterized protein n=1 Tax=Stackebrandtia albiflava TaxID=406432 RepID=A0A562UQ03_9ACTN|nr:hypothetical protein [Stackebrandtia albiflava]TWJ07701.1 hypothetical protein LX16_4860 [Stackebrandtia albiflava]
MRIVHRLGDLLLDRVLIGVPASAGCPTETYTDWDCYYGRMRKRTCTVMGNCTTSCGSWTQTPLAC